MQEIEKRPRPRRTSVSMRTTTHDLLVSKFRGKETWDEMLIRICREHDKWEAMQQ